MQKNILHIRPLILGFAALLSFASLWGKNPSNENSPNSTPEEAVALIDSIQVLQESRYWKNIDPSLFMNNLRNLVLSPLQYYEGHATNFCAYTALTFLPIQNDPLGFCKFMLDLYNDGKGTLHKTRFTPSPEIFPEAGLLKNKGALDINPAIQLWFLCLADRFKGYLNFMDWGYDKGDDNTLWAATNFSKFNRMLRKLTPLKIKGWGSDLLRPLVKIDYEFLRGKLDSGTVFLYISHWMLNKRKMTLGPLNVPSHYMLLMDIQQISRDKINIYYWGYGKKSMHQVSPKMLRKIIFGVTLCKKTRQ